MSENQSVILKNVSGDVWTCSACAKTVQPGTEHRCGSDAGLSDEAKKIVADAEARGTPFSDAEARRVGRDAESGS